NKVHDATPAAFAASAEDRGMDAELTRDIIENEVDVVLGGGGGDFSDDVMNLAEEKGYKHITTEDELANTDSDKILGLFNDSYMNYILDRDDLNSKEPNVYEMTKKSIDVLSKDEDGFFLMSEGARIDHAAHADDIPGVVAETLDFDKAVKYSVDWAKENGDTLVVVVADHETMGFSVTEPIDKEALKDIEVSPEYMAGKMIEKDDGNGFLIESIKDVFKEYADVELSDEEAKEFNESILQEDGSLKYPYLIGYQIGSIIAEKYDAGSISPEVRAKSSTAGHTLNSVPIFAYGEGSEEFNDVIQNTEFAELLFEALGK
ncbi:MAG: alkaline phosphatase, partial [Halanaerobiales bacterium]